jgi:Fe-S cluster assembly iron-binding protein IscA
MEAALKSQNKNAVRFELTGFGWSGPTFDIALDEQKNDDAVLEVEGVKFVAEKDFAHLIKNPEIIKVEGRFAIKDAGCCC